MTKPHCIYVIAGSFGAVKIGISHQPTERLETLNHSSPLPLSLFYCGELLSQEAARKVERLVHAALKPKRSYFECSMSRE